MATILVVEDERPMAEGLAYNLERAGYRVLGAADGREGLRLARQRGPDLVVLDLMLPGIDGFEFLKRLRAEGSRVPVIVLSALDAEVDKIRGLDAGADDFVTKPFGVGELLARIRVRLGHRDEPVATFALGRSTVDLRRGEVVRGRSRVPLTPTEVALLGALRRCAGVPVPREDLLRSLWGAEPSATRTLDTHVARLRKKVEDDPSTPRHLVTVHGVGYRLDP